MSSNKLRTCPPKNLLLPRPRAIAAPASYEPEPTFNRVQRFGIPADALLRLQSGTFRITGVDVPADARVVDVQLHPIAGEDGAPTESLLIVPIVESEEFEPIPDGGIPPVMPSVTIQKIDLRAALEAAYHAGVKLGNKHGGKLQLDPEKDGLTETEIAFAVACLEKVDSKFVTYYAASGLQEGQ